MRDFCFVNLKFIPKHNGSLTVKVHMKEENVVKQLADNWIVKISWERNVNFCSETINNPFWDIHTGLVPRRKFYENAAFSCDTASG